ncbi:MAG: acyl-CoA thioesterase [Marmoricola sp.]
MEETRPTYRHHVRYHETDSQGYLFNARYLEVVDVAMTEYLRSLGYSYEAFVAEGADPSVVRAELDFKRPARFDDLLDVTVHCVDVGRSSFRLRTTIAREGEELAVATLVYVNVDVDAETSRALPEPVAAALRADLQKTSTPDVEIGAADPTYV